MRRAVALAVAAALAAGRVLAQAELGGPEGAELTVRVENAHDGYDLPVGAFGAAARPVERVEGAAVWSAWRLDDPDATVAGVMRAYRERLAEDGFTPVWQCEGRGCGGFDFRFGAEILPAPGMRVDVRDFAQLSARHEATGEVVSVLVSRVLGDVHVQTVAVAPGAAPPPALVAAPGGETSRATALLPQDQRSLLAALRRDGHVPIEGLSFEPGGVALSPASAEALDMLARLLDRDDELRVAIVGHSDNQGALDFNLDLSRRRAESVMQALVERGVPAGQLEAHGLGFLAPVASNATEEGRAANRRVELVLR